MDYRMTNQNNRFSITKSFNNIRTIDSIHDSITITTTIEKACIYFKSNDENDASIIYEQKNIKRRKSLKEPRKQSDDEKKGEF